MLIKYYVKYQENVIEILREMVNFKEILKNFNKF